MSRLRSLIPRRVFHPFTSAGILFLAALALTGAGAFLTGNNLLFLIFAAMMALLLVSGFLSRLVLSGLELELLLPEHVAARAPAPSLVRIRNLKRLMPSFSIELSGVSKETPAILTTPVYFPLIPGGATIEAAITVVFPRRGRHRENLFLLSTRFPFGFLTKSTTVALRRETIVYPALEPQPGMEALLESLAGEADARHRGMGRDFYRIRAHEPQDSARHVDWKSSARTGSLQVREFTRDRQPAVEMYFDRRIAPGQLRAMDDFEDLVEKCAFVAWELSGRETGLVFTSQRFHIAVPDSGEIYDILKFLSLTEPVTQGETVGGNDAAEEFLLDLSDDMNVPVLFSPRPDAVRGSGWGAGCVVGPSARQEP